MFILAAPLDKSGTTPAPAVIKIFVRVGETCNLFWKLVTERQQDGSQRVNVSICDFICDRCDRTQAQALTTTI